MEEAVDEELKLSELMRKDALRELDVLQTMSSSLLVFDFKRKHIESHFESLVEKIERKRDEAIEAIRVREEEAKAEDERRLEELRLREVRVEELRKGVFGEIFVRSKGLNEELERFEGTLRVREKEIERRVSEFERSVAEFERRAAEFEVEGKREVERLCGENLALQEEVKLLTEKLKLKSKVPGQEEQLATIQKFLHVLTSAGIINICTPIKQSEFSGRELFIVLKDNINDQETAISKVSSFMLEAKDNAPEIVLEALRISYISESEEQNSPWLLGSCRILLLEQLGQICPQRISQARKEALKVAVEWSARIESCVDKSVEIIRFLQFLSMYDIASEFSNEVLVPMLHCIAVHEGTPDFCFKLGFSNRIAGYIKTMIKNNQRLKALDYVSTFKMAKEFSVVKIIRGHLKGLKKNCQKMRKEGVDGKAVEVQVLDFEMNTLKEMIKCIKEFKLQSLYPTGNLEQRVAKLKKQKYFNKRPAPCSDPSSVVEPPRKKGCNLPGTAKSPEVIPNKSKAHPEIGLRGQLCSGPNSDPEPLRKNKSKLPETVKSAEVAPNASNAYPEISSRDLLNSNPNNDLEPQRKNECKLPGTTKLTEVAQNTSNVYPETGSKDVLMSKPNSDPEPSRNKGSHLPRTAKLPEIAPNTSNAYLKVGSRGGLSFKPNSDTEPLRDKRCNLPGAARLMEIAPNTPNAYPKIVSRDALCSKPNSNPEPLRNKGFYLPGPAKPHVIAPKVTLNPYLEIGSRNALHSQEMQKAPLCFDPLQFHPGVHEASPYSSISSRPSCYQPPLPTQPPQNYHPRLLLGGYPQVPSLRYPVPNRPYFDYMH